jgi:uncharacterized GH25 family protein
VLLGDTAVRPERNRSKIMIRGWLCVVCVALAVGQAQAHFLYLVPGDGSSSAVRVVFGDTMKPDADEPPAVVRDGVFSCVAGSGQASPLKPIVNEHDFTLMPSTGAVGVCGTVEYGVALRGQDEPVLIVYHASAALADRKPTNGGKDRVLEIAPVVRPEGVAFAVMSNGKPVVSADVVVEVPGEKRPRAVKTDAKGMTPAFEPPGTYSARTSWLEDRAGEFRGRSYKQVRHYATLVVRRGEVRQP